MTAIGQSIEGIPPLLDLIWVASVKKPDHVLAGERVFVTSVEFWSAFTCIRLVWPVRPAASFDDLYPTAVIADGQRYGCGQWRMGGIRAHSDMLVTTDVPINASSTALGVQFPVGRLQISLGG